jgi:hypothetical protein
MGEQVKALAGHAQQVGSGSYVVTGELITLQIGGAVITIIDADEYIAKHGGEGTEPFALDNGAPFDGHSR